MNKYFNYIIIIGILCLILPSCASIFGDKNRTLHISSVPIGAKVYLNNAEVGRTPTEVALGNPIFNSYLVRVEKNGYDPITKVVQTSFQGVGVLNILFWPGFIVDAITGDMVKITNPMMRFNLSKK